MINRVDRRSQLECLKQCGQLLKAGASVLFFPEGTRSKDGRMHAFKKGAFSVAAKAKVGATPCCAVPCCAVQQSYGWLGERTCLRVRRALLCPRRVLLGSLARCWPLPTPPPPLPCPARRCL